MLREGLIGFHLKDLASSVRTAVRTCGAAVWAHGSASKRGLIQQTSSIEHGAS